jgi:hypothetical protein
MIVSGGAKAGKSIERKPECDVCKYASKIERGQPVALRVKNADGAMAEEFIFIRQ